jgi:hypothetical protein
MDLLINYGTTASAGGQPVIAEIEVTQASTNQYDLNIINSATIDAFDANLTDSNRYRTSYVAIQNNTIKITSFTEPWPYGGIFWYDNSSGNMTHIGWHNLVSYDYRGQLLGTIPLEDFSDISSYIPNNATHFRITSANESLPLIIISSSTPAGATTTFYDSYPDGNVIGTTNGTEVAGVGTSQYNLTYIDNEFYQPQDGIIGTWPDHMRTNKVEIISNSIILSLQPSHIFFWNNDNYIGYYSNQDQQGIRLGDFNSNINNGVVNIPTNATHFALMGDVRVLGYPPYTTSWEQFQTITASYSNLGYLQIDPPTGKRIKQIALKGL